MRDIEGEVVAIHVLSVAVNNHLLVILIHIIYMHIYISVRYIREKRENLFFPDSPLNITLFDKCGYHYTPRQHFTDKEWKSKGWLVGQNHRKNNQPTTPKPQPATIDNY